MRRSRISGILSMCTFCIKRAIFTIIALMLSTAINAAPFVSSTASNQTQMKQFLKVYNMLMATKSDTDRENSLLRSSFTSKKKTSKKFQFSKRLHVTATAYTSHRNQTDSTPNIAAWGDRLHPGMKVIAVSRDLLSKYGLKHKQKVHIKGLTGDYLVLDKMNKRWRKKIDIYMGKDKRKAFRWGRRRVEILWD